MTDLADFLLARIAEDEEVARAAMVGFPTGEWTDDGGIYAGHPTREVVDWAYLDTRPHIARWDPARVLAECEAKRELLALADPYDFADDGGTGMSVHADTIRRLLALPYADHPDYLDEWKP